MTDFPIRQVTIHGQEYSVKVCDLGDTRNGDFCSTECQIRIHKDYPQPFRALVHEVAHGGLHESGLDELFSPGEVEAICVAMEQAIAPLLREYIDSG